MNAPLVRLTRTPAPGDATEDGEIWHVARCTGYPEMVKRAAGILGPGLLLGWGLGGFVDGIVLHQILQWHHLLSARGHSFDVQSAADGVFHAVAWVAVLSGVVWLWRRARAVGHFGDRKSPSLLGPILAGWGLFNLTEGLTAHHLLDLHHVRAGPHQLWYDLGFLFSGVALVAVGLIRHATADTNRSREAGRRPARKTL